MIRLLSYIIIYILILIAFWFGGFRFFILFIFPDFSYYWGSGMERVLWDSIFASLILSIIFSALTTYMILKNKKVAIVLFLTSFTIIELVL
ncbi:hypothetical protein, partial [Avibacterium avium]|uniref:hypothetical protein n=3 Tax=Avibacterium avium TaxID=751 RepID=UPI003BF8C424